MSTLTSENPSVNAMVSNSGSWRNQGQGKGQSRKKQKHSKKRTRNQEVSDDSDSDSNQRSRSKSKDSSMQCYYCCKRGHKATECRLRERAKKIRTQKGNSKKTSKLKAAVNAAIAGTTTKTVNEATIADALA